MLNKKKKKLLKRQNMNWSFQVTILKYLQVRQNWQSEPIIYIGRQYKHCRQYKQKHVKDKLKQGTLNYAVGHSVIFQNKRG